MLVDQRHIGETEEDRELKLIVNEEYLKKLEKELKLKGYSEKLYDYDRVQDELWELEKSEYMDHYA